MLHPSDIYIYCYLTSSPVVWEDKASCYLWSNRQLAGNTGSQIDAMQLVKP